MFVDVSATQIEKLKENEVTSPLIYELHRHKTPDNQYFDENGLFSKRIFGNLYRCNCGKLTHEGFCEECGTRVVTPKNMPDFYIDLKAPVARLFADYSKLNIEDVEGLINYTKFLYNGDVLELDENRDISKYNPDDVKIGVDALKELGVDDEWIKENTIDFLCVPHPVYRPLVISNTESPYITPVNRMYMDIIKRIGNVIEMGEETKGRVFYVMAEYHAISELYKSIVAKLINELQDTKFSIIKSEVISHPISGAVRAVLINRHDVNEDVLVVGDALVETLWPYLWKKHHGDVVEINRELIEGRYTVLVNRAPTISHMSIIAMKPRIASLYPFGKIGGTNGCLTQNVGYINRNREQIGVFPDQHGDVERFGQGLEDGIDTVGIRCIGMNPIVFDGLAADTDGDVLLVIALYSRDAIEESYSMLPSNCYTNYANDTIRNHIIEDFIFVDKGDEIE
jgi:hypothetical protein